MHFRGIVYRALNPLWAREPLSGAGAARFGGRFNPKGIPSLYTSLDPLTAIREANQVGSFQPVTLIAIELSTSPLLDFADADALDHLGVSAVQLTGDNWRALQTARQPAPTQAFALKAIEAGYTGFIVPSFVHSASPDSRNLVLWSWDCPGSTTTVIDDETRLR